MLLLATSLVALCIATTVPLYRLGLRAAARGLPPRRPPTGPLPARVAFFTCTRPDEPSIGAKIADLAACVAAVPGSRAFLFVDGGAPPRVTEHSVEIVHAPRRVGKLAGLDRLLAIADADVAVLSDVNVFLDPATVREALGRFADPKTGAVQFVVENRQDDAELAGALHGYAGADLEVSAHESRLGSMVHLDGSACAVRTAPIRPLVPGTADDQAMAFDILLAGERIELHPVRAAYEVGRTTLRAELARKVRVACNSVSTHLAYNPGLGTLPPRLRLFYFAHKVLRWLLPLQLVLFGLLVAALIWRGFGIETVLALAVAGVAGLAVGAAVSLRVRRLLVLLAFLAASGWGVLRAVAGRRFVAWHGSRAPADLARAGHEPEGVA